MLQIRVYGFVFLNVSSSSFCSFSVEEEKKKKTKLAKGQISHLKVFLNAATKTV